MRQLHSVGYIRSLVQSSLKCALSAALLATAWPASAADPQPVFDSKLVTAATPGHGVAVDVPLDGAKHLYLVAADGSKRFACDWADWAEPRLVGKSV